MCVSHYCNCWILLLAVIRPTTAKKNVCFGFLLTLETKYFILLFFGHFVKRFNLEVYHNPYKSAILNVRIKKKKNKRQTVKLLNVLILWRKSLSEKKTKSLLRTWSVTTFVFVCFMVSVWTYTIMTKQKKIHKKINEKNNSSPI